jgi:hypothetical protein
MKYLLLFMPLLIIPIVGLTLASRWIWTTILGLLAGVGVASAKQNDFFDVDQNPQGVKCYEIATPPSMLQGTPWEYVDEMEMWAGAEQAIFDTITVSGNDRVDYDLLQRLIQDAERAATAAKGMVARQKLREETYNKAIEILQNWHADVATSKSSVKCYERVTVPPYVADISQQLMSLEKLQEQGKLSESVIAQVRTGIKGRMVKKPVLKYLKN